jgi:hypothetical protein
MEMPLGFLLIVAMLGSFYWLSWLRENRWQPNRKLKALSSGPLARLAHWGFEPTYQAFAAELRGGASKMPVAMVGHVQGYAVEASFGWNDEDYLMIRVFFEPPSRKYEALMQAWRTQQTQAKQWKFAKGFFKPFRLFCAPVYVDATFSYANSPPEPGELLRVADAIIKELQVASRAPLAYEAACTLANDVIQESKCRTSTRKVGVGFVSSQN